MAGLGVPAGYVLVYCPGLAHVLLNKAIAHVKGLNVNVKGETYKCTKSAQQKLTAGENLIVQAKGRWRAHIGQ